MTVEFGPPRYQIWIGRLFILAVILGILAVLGGSFFHVGARVVR